MLRMNLSSDGIAHIVLARPERGNSLGQDEAKGLEGLLDKIESKKLQGVLFSSVGSRFFCAGGNLEDQRRLSDPESTLRTQKAIATQLDRLSKLKIPTGAAIDGDCFGGGMELLAAFDFVLATPHSFFGLWQGRLGLTPGWGGVRLQNRVGQKRGVG